MAKPRIIIADTDFGYIVPLQLKFVDEFFNKIDLEIITDKDYFEELFDSPQTADILIVSEDLYDLSLQRHNISNVFLMVEQYEEEQTAALNVVKLYKYTSIKEIFNEIIGKSADSLHVKVEQKKETEVILVYSAAGGTGKTTVALGVSASLTKNYKKVLYMNASRLQSFQRMFENSSPIASMDVYAKLANLNENIYEDIKHVIRKEGFSYLPPFKSTLMSLGLEYSIYETIAMSAKKSNDYDYIIIDADACFDERTAQLLNIADKVIIVTDQSSTSVYSTNILVSNINGINTDKYMFVCNKYDIEKDNALILPSMDMKFSINEYVQYYENYNQLKSNDFALDTGIQKTAFLII